MNLRRQNSLVLNEFFAAYTLFRYAPGFTNCGKGGENNQPEEKFACEIGRKIFSGSRKQQSDPTAAETFVTKEVLQNAYDRLGMRVTTRCGRGATPQEIKNRRHEAEECFIKAVSMAPTHTEYAVERGNFYAKNGLKTKAMTVFQNTLKRDPESEKIKLATKNAADDQEKSRPSSHHDLREPTLP